MIKDADRLARWVAKTWRFRDHGPWGEQGAYTAHRLMSVGMADRVVRIGKVRRHDMPYITCLQEEWQRWYDLKTPGYMLGVHVAFNPEGVAWAIGWDVDDLVAAVPKLMWETMEARTDRDDDTFRGQIFMRLPIITLQEHDLIQYSTTGVPVVEVEPKTLWTGGAA